MTTLSILGDDRVAPGRPEGVTGIAAIFAAAAFASAVLSVLTGVGRLPLAAGAFLVGSGMETAGSLVFVVFAALAAIAAIGLLRLAGWARWLALSVALWGMWEAIVPISSAVIDFRIIALLREGLAFIIRGVIVWYLLQPQTRDTFSSPHPHSSMKGSS